jgi:hypothetical protein
VKQIETGAILASVDFNMFKIGCLQGLAGPGEPADLPGMERNSQVRDGAYVSFPIPPLFRSLQGPSSQSGRRMSGIER